MDMDIKIGGEPPAAKGRAAAGKWLPLAEAAKSNPGEWVSIAGVSTNLSSQIRHAKASGFEKSSTGWWEATNREVDQKEKTCTVWVRYHLGERKADAS